MPQPENNRLKFKNLGARWFAPWLSILISSILQPLAGCLQENESTRVTELPQPNGFYFVGIEHGNPTTTEPNT